MASLIGGSRRAMAANGVALLISAVLSAAGCSTVAPPTVPTPRPPDARAATDVITEDGLRSHLIMLADVTDAATGYRSVGSPGYDAATDLVADALRGLGWSVTDDAFDAPTFADDGESVLEAGGRTYGVDDVRPLIFAPPGAVSGPVVAIDWRPGASDRTGRGCQAADYGDLPQGAIVLVRSGPCFRRDQVIAAQAAGAGGFVAGYGSAPSGSVPRSTLIDPGGLEIPAIAASGLVADALAALSEAGGTARITTTGRTTETPTRSIIAELAGSEPGSVVMLGAHLDSVIDGPGINDDGSGVAALLAIARALRETRPRATVRLAFWSGEELGLLGSSHYVAGLTDAERTEIVAYLNADMVGSPNGFAGVYDEASAPDGAKAITALLSAAVERAGARPVPVDLAGVSDHLPFGRAGIATGGLFSGASEKVDATQAASHDATAGQPADGCYHRPCDDLTNVDLELARVLTAALADVTVRLANTPELLAH
ncbi:MAG: M20/M25/M40 family metallo-hydrolase [Candidatus Limnocylindrales bacterium]